MSLHTAGIKLEASLNVTTAVLTAATREIGVVHLYVTKARKENGDLLINRTY